MSHTPTPTRRDSDGHLRYLLTAYLFENLSAAGRTEVETHLAACASCREEFERLKKTLGMATEALKLDAVEYQFDARRRERVMATAEEAMQRRSSQRIGVAKVSSAKKAERSAAQPNRKGTATSFSLSRTLLVVVPLLLVVSLVMASMTSVRYSARASLRKIGNAVESSTSKGLEDGGFSLDANDQAKSPAPAAAQAEEKSGSVVIVTELAKPKDAVDDDSAAARATKNFKAKEDTYRRVEYPPPANAPADNGVTLKFKNENPDSMEGNVYFRRDSAGDAGGGGVDGKTFDGLVGRQKAEYDGRWGGGTGTGEGNKTKSKNSGGKEGYFWQVEDGQQAQLGQSGQNPTQGVQTATKEVTPQDPQRHWEAADPKTRFSVYSASGPDASVQKPVETQRPRIRHSGGGCFPAGTLVKTESGFQAIETIQPGTQVFACNPASGEWSLQPVTQVLTHEYAGDLITLQCGDTLFEATGNHPVWVCSGENLAARPRVKDLRGETQQVTAEGRWVEARALREGDQLITPAGRVNLNVLKTQETRQTVFNLTVTQEHTYAVSALGILVHNKEAAAAPEEETHATDPNATNMSTIEVPRDVLAKAELKDHFETVNPDRPDTQSAFGNPDAHMFHETPDQKKFNFDEEAKSKLGALEDGKPNADDWSKLPPKQDSAAGAYESKKKPVALLDSRIETPAPETPKAPVSTLTGKDNTEGVPEEKPKDLVAKVVEPTKPEPVKTGRWLFAAPKTELAFDADQDQKLGDVDDKEEVLQDRKLDTVRFKSMQGFKAEKWGDGNGKGLELSQGMTTTDIKKLKEANIRQQQAVEVAKENEAKTREEKLELEGKLGGSSSQSASFTSDPNKAESLLRGFDFARSSMPDLRFQDYVAHPQAVPPAERTDWGLDEDAFIEQKGYRPFVDCARDHLSTFGMDVSTASYTRTRGLLQEGRMPEPEEVRTEEFVNYFKEFGLGQSVPASDTFAVWAECAPEALNTPSSNSPAAEVKRSSGERIELLKVAIASREPRADERKPAVLTLVVDVSGSMRQAQSATHTADRLELVRDALKDLVANLQPEDSVCIVAFHEQASLALPRTQARQKQRILEAIDGLTPHGGTNVEAGLQLGYRMAEEAFSADGVNRVLLCSDGVANTGARGPDELKSLVKTFAGRGIDLNAIGFGLGQYNDKMLEQLAQTGNGACFFVDKLEEAKKVFKEQLPPNLNVLARDAKVQVEFNPERVERYRLLGYEKRKIKDEDFRNDKVDGGEMAHQTRVTALYELIMKEGQHGSLGKVFLRWKDAGLRHLPVIERNYPLEEQIRSTESSPELRLLNCVAAFAELLNQNPHRRDSSFSRIQEELERLPEAFQRHPKVQELRAMLGAAQKAWITQNIKALTAGNSK